MSPFTKGDKNINRKGRTPISDGGSSTIDLVINNSTGETSTYKSVSQSGAGVLANLRDAVNSGKMVKVTFKAARSLGVAL